jgi:hypothetical protein
MALTVAVTVALTVAVTLYTVATGIATGWLVNVPVTSLALWRAIENGLAG